jgi:hypothetical protein
MPHNKPIRIDDLNGQGDGLPDAQVPRNAADSDGIHAHTRRLQQRLAELQGKKCESSLKAHEGFIHTSRLFVALSQMNLASTQEEAITTITEILTNFIGTEQFACLTFREDQRQLECLFSMGVDEDRIAALELASEEMAALLRSEPQIGMSGCAGLSFSDLVAVVPLRWRDEPFGLIVILALLPQKNSLELWDYALCDLLSEHAAACISRKRIATEG